ncbi:MAG TPA: hypothetical protein VG714_07560 [Acidobacteriaceae bacterium]|nr:hypothetical protein [Acidobacteriaceae bacterium]
MSSISILGALGYLEVVLCTVGLILLVAKKQWADYSWLGCFLAVRALSDLILTYVYKFAVHQVGLVSAYHYYFWVYWCSFAIESILTLMIVYGVFRLAMAPLKGLQTLGMLVFKWAAGISVAVALGSAFAPNMKGTALLISAVSQLQRTQSILTLCLLLFVCFAIRPMGLSYGNRIFGVGLGLGIMSANDLVQSAWLMFNPNMKTTYNLINGVVICVILAVWTIYFVLPEPKRRIIVLPTTSPFLRWNQISQALGDDPGFVAVGGVPPEVFAPAELEVMRRASAKMPTPFQAPAPKVTDFPKPARAVSSAI